MGIFSWLRGTSTAGSAPETKASAAMQIVAERHLGRPVWTDRDIADFAREAYRVNAIGYRCVRMIAQAAAAVPLLMHDEAGNEIENHPLLGLLDAPSPLTGRTAFLESLYSFLLLSGNTYIESVSPLSKSEPSELWVLRPDRMRIVPGKFGMPQAYEYRVGGKKKEWPVNPINGQSKILHIKEFSPLDDWYGMSRIEAAAYGVDRHNSASEHNKALLDNGATPSGALVFEPVTVNGNAVHAPQAVVDAAMAKLEKEHGGSKNAGRPMVVGGKAKWESMGLTPKDMDFGNGKDDAARDICTALGVPYILMVKGDATYNNIREAKLEFYEETILPLVLHVCTALSKWKEHQYNGDRSILSPDMDEIPALEPRREMKRESTIKLLEKGVLDQDEAREALQYGPRKAGSVTAVDAQVLTALIGTVSTVGISPLARYMRSVGLIDQGVSDEEILEQALALSESNEEDDEDSNVDLDEDDQETEDNVEE